MNINFRKKMLVASVLAATSIASSAVYANDGIENSVDLSFRYRIETVNQDNISEDALASTIRTRATIKTKWNSAIDSVLEFDDVSEFIGTDFNSGQGTTPNRSQYPVVADPVGTEVNQAYVRYSFDNTKIAYGRQRILLDNQRFVGGVGWRQNEQTFDSFTVNSKKDAFDFSYSYVFNVNRIFGESVPAGDHAHNTHLLNLGYKLGAGKFSGYYYSIDNEDAAGLSNTTFGISYNGKVNQFGYTFEFANQSDAGDNPNSYDANYYLVEGKYIQDVFTIGAGVEKLGGDVAGGQGFTTSLATGHKFQGWADLFLNTPAAGIEDKYVNGTFKAGGFNFNLVYHDFNTDEGGVALGSEIDFSMAKKFNENYSMLIKYADFSSDNLSYSSVDKLWLMFTYKM